MVPPRATAVELEPSLTVIDELANLLLAMFDKPKVIVPELVMGEPLSTSIPSVPVMATLVTVPVVVL
jgi:hypothetical protein